MAELMRSLPSTSPITPCPAGRDRGTSLNRFPIYPWKVDLISEERNLTGISKRASQPFMVLPYQRTEPGTIPSDHTLSPSLKRDNERGSEGDQRGHHRALLNSMAHHLDGAPRRHPMFIPFTEEPTMGGKGSGTPSPSRLNLACQKGRAGCQHLPSLPKARQTGDGDRTHL